MTTVDYENPPVIETVLGVQFEPFPGMHNGHLGAFWKTLAPEWTSVTDAPSLEPQLETFTDSLNWGAMSIQFKLTRDLTHRLQIRNQNGDRMIQVQNGRLHLNWLGHDKGADYPRYCQMREEFDKTLNLLKGFLERENLGELRPNQWEITYINRIDRSTVWKNPDDWVFFRPLAERVDLSMVKLESFGGEWHYEIPARRGRLHVQFRHVRSPELSVPEAVILTLTARGGVEEGDSPLSLSDGLDLGHETIVTSFKELNSKNANKHWGLKNGNS